MNTKTIGILLASILAAANCRTTAPIEPITSYQDSIVKINGISKTAAIETAKEAASSLINHYSRLGLLPVRRSCSGA